MGNLKEYMLIFRISQTGYPITKENDAILNKQWKKFIAMIAAQVKLINISRLSAEGLLLSEHSVENKPFNADGLLISGYLTMKSENIEDVILIAKKCPILLVGGTVEVRETILMK